MVLSNSYGACSFPQEAEYSGQGSKNTNKQNKENCMIKNDITFRGFSAKLVDVTFKNERTRSTLHVFEHYQEVKK